MVESYLEGKITISLMFLALVPFGTYTAMLYFRYWRRLVDYEEDYNLIQEIVATILIPPTLLIGLPWKILKGDNE